MTKVDVNGTTITLQNQITIGHMKLLLAGVGVLRLQGKQP